jgi:adenine-specific DNA methylase
MENDLMLFDLFKQLVPNGTKEVEIDGVKVKVTKDDDIFEVSAVYDNTDIKNLIKEYKETIEKLDDDIFLEATEELGKIYDLTKFNELLDAKSLTEEESDLVEKIINKSIDLISTTVQNKIQDLLDLYERL